MTSRQDSFADLYSHYRIGPAIDWHSRRARWDRTRRVWLLSALPGLLGVAALAEALAAARVADVFFCTGLAFACTIAALALATRIVASAAAARREARSHIDTAVALESVSSPAPNATEEEVSAWVQRVESTLRPAVPPEAETSAGKLPPP
jgi:SMODS and SLOG-associating 2TM effector domain 1